MINRVKDFQNAVDQALISVEALHAGIDDLPANHVTNVSLIGEDEILEQVAEIREYVDGPAGREDHLGPDGHDR